MSTVRTKRRGAMKSRKQYFKFIETLEERRLLSFTIAVIPDTQHMTQAGNNQMAAETAWIKSQQTALNIQFAVQLGDITNDGAEFASEWTQARAGMDNIAAMGIPFGVVQGNHDHDNWGGHPNPIPQGYPTGTTSFNGSFGPSSTYFSGKSWYGSMPTGSPYYDSGGTNSWQKFTADGQTFLNICLEDEASDLALQWADTVIAANPGVPVIISSHQVIDNNNAYTALEYHLPTAPGAPDTPSGGNSGADIAAWAKTHDNQIFLILCAHASSSVDGSGWAQSNGFLTITGNTNKTIWIQEQDYQEVTAGPNGASQLDGGAEWARLMTIDLSTRTIVERTYSPAWGHYADELPAVYGILNPFNESPSQSGFVLTIPSTMPQVPTQAAMPMITISASGSPSESGPTTGTYTLSRTGSTTNSLNVGITISGTATNGTDYNTIPTTVTFAPGSSTAVVTLTPKVDGLTEPTESVTLTVNVGTGYSTGYSVTTPLPSATLNIANSGGGAVSVYDGFNYTVGNGSNLAGHNTGTGLGANWAVSSTTNINVLSGSLNYTGGGHSLATAANKVTATGYSYATGTASQSMGTIGSTVWVGFEFASNNGGTTQPIQGDLELNPSAGGGTGVRFGAPFGGNIDGRITVGTYDSFISTTIPVVSNQTYFIVASIQYLSTGDVIKLYVNPTPGVLPATPTATKTLPASVVLPVTSSFLLYSPQASVATFDEVRIGTSYAEVAPEASSPPPAAPSGAAVAPSGTSLNVTWVDNSGTVETGFHVWRSTDNVNFTSAKTTLANATSWLDNTVTAGTLYYYKVTSFNANGDSAFSNTVSATAPVTLPAAPSNLVAKPGTNNVVLTWSDNATNETGFKVYRSTDNATWGTAYATINTVNTMTYTDAAPASGTAYYYKVTAFNGSGESAGAGMSCAVATVIASDGFNYTVGDATNIAGHNTGVGLGANWTTSGTTTTNVLSGSLNYSAAGHGLTTSANSVQVNNYGSATATMSQTIGTIGTTVWVGFEFSTFRTNQAQLDAGDLEINPSAGAGTGIRLGAPFGGNIDGRVNIGTYDGFISTSIPVVENTTYFIVAKIQYLSTGDVINLYVNPTPGVTPTTPTATKTLPATVTAPVSSNIILYAPQTNFATFDEIRIGTSYAAVAPDPLVEFSGPAIAMAKAPEFVPAVSNGRKLAISRIPMLAPISIGRSVFEQRPAIQAPLAGARRPDASTHPADDADLLEEDPGLE